MYFPPQADPNSTAAVQSLLDRIREGDQPAIQVLLSATLERLRALAKKIAGNIPRVKQFEQTDDLLQNSMVRLWKAFERHHPPTPLDYYRLASAIMRRELIDMSRHYFGRRGWEPTRFEHPRPPTLRVSRRSISREMKRANHKNLGGGRSFINTWKAWAMKNERCSIYSGIKA